MLLTIIAVVVLFTLVFLLAVHLGFRAPRLANKQTPQDFGLSYENIAFAGHQGCQLSAWWLPAKHPSQTTVVLLHGWGANKSLMLPLAEPFHRLGWHVTLVDAHNHGDSEHRGVSTMPKFAEDLESALVWLKHDKPKEAEDVIVMGHSVGAAATLLAASRGLDVRGVISLASFAHPKMVMQRQLQKARWVPGLAWLVIHYVQWVIGHKLDDIAPINAVKKIAIPFLLVHGDQDQIVPLSDHRELCKVASDNKNTRCLVLPETDHASIETIQIHFADLERFIDFLRLSR
ncbi:MAG: alpha/beta fold hydrolase [Hydrogenovibrio sp.]|uniref:alpha/beta hydrolase n=1 Tax=Hydrogenovibrio sp. TaxID=2065821 RepID=UPI00286FDB27|nr:alpha/beta fold hydrolase [Hydrogenovibrio sp.]MDR9499978.1 alpha/beta fold hydrolase [Hydrogenovibrio sp.]